MLRFFQAGLRELNGQSGLGVSLNLWRGTERTKVALHLWRGTKRPGGAFPLKSGLDMPCPFGKEQKDLGNDWSGLPILKIINQVLEVTGLIRLSWKGSDRSQRCIVMSACLEKDQTGLVSDWFYPSKCFGQSWNLRELVRKVGEYFVDPWTPVVFSLWSPTMEVSCIFAVPSTVHLRLLLKRIIKFVISKEQLENPNSIESPFYTYEEQG